MAGAQSVRRMASRLHELPQTRTAASWSSPWLFFAVVFAWSWAFWSATAVLGLSVIRGHAAAMSRHRIVRRYRYRPTISQSR